MHRAWAGETAVVLPYLPEAAVSTLQATPYPSWAQSFAYSTSLPGTQGDFEGGGNMFLLCYSPGDCSIAVLAFYLVLQDKITKEVNFILANQETIQSQITQLEAAIKHMEVCFSSALLK